MRTFGVGMKRKAQFLNKAEKDRLRGANGLLRWFCKGGVSLQSKMGWICKGAVGTQRWGQIAKDIYVRGKVGIKRKRTAEAALMR